MSGRRYRLTGLAASDIEQILTYTHWRFGSTQFERYAALIDRAVEMVAEDPLRPSSRQRDELGDGVRSFHLAIAAAKRSAASHVLYYLVQETTRKRIVILRVLHEGMEPVPLVLEGLQELD